MRGFGFRVQGVESRVQGLRACRSSRAEGGAPPLDVGSDRRCLRPPKQHPYLVVHLHTHTHVVTYIREVKREFCIENPLARIHFIIEMIWWTGLAPWEFEFPFPGILISTLLVGGAPSRRR